MRRVASWTGYIPINVNIVASLDCAVSSHEGNDAWTSSLTARRGKLGASAESLVDGCDILNGHFVSARTLQPSAPYHSGRDQPYLQIAPQNLFYGDVGRR